MFWLGVVSIFVAISTVWAASSSIIYRYPALMMLLGVVLASIGAWWSYVLQNVAEIPELIKLFPYSDLASILVGATLAATGAGIIASAIVLRAQRGYEREQKIAGKEIRMLSEELDFIASAYDRILEEKSLTHDLEKRAKIEAVTRQLDKIRKNTDRVAKKIRN